VSEQERRRIYDERWAAGGTNFMAAFNDLIVDQRANDTAADFVRDMIREYRAAHLPRGPRGEDEPAAIRTS